MNIFIIMCYLWLRQLHFREELMTPTVTAKDSACGWGRQTLVKVHGARVGSSHRTTVFFQAFLWVLHCGIFSPHSTESFVGTQHFILTFFSLLQFQCSSTLNFNISNLHFVSHLSCYSIPEATI